MNLNFAQFTEKARKSVTQAHALTKQCGYAAIEPQLLVVAIIREGGDMVPFLMNQVGVDHTRFCQALSQSMQQLPHNPNQAPGFSPGLERAMAHSFECARRDGSSLVALEHLFLALGEVQGPIQSLLSQFGVTPQKLKQAVDVFRNGSMQQSAPAEENNSGLPTLRHYGQDMVKLARDGAIEPVIGRDVEIRRILQIISRKTKNNPILVGEPGTGKTAIIEGLAHRFASGEVPEELKRMKLFTLNLSSVVAGAGAQGEIEERMKKIIKEMSSEPDLIVFIDEIHMLMDVGGGGGMDAANILKPELARGVLKLIGATTLDEYTKYIEKDKAFERRFQKVLVEEPDVDSAISILRGIKSRFEKHHHVKILDEAVVAAVRLSHRYISDRFLPDKAIDLLDEAASTMRIDRSAAPVELESLKQQIRNKEIERESLRQDNSSADLTALGNEIAELREKENILHAKWRNERNMLQQVQQLATQIEQMEVNRETAEQQGRFTEAVELKNRIATMRSRLTAMNEELGGKQEALLKPAVDESDIMSVVTAWTGIPMSNLSKEENEKLIHIEDGLHGTIVGQDAAVKAVANVVRRNRMGLSDAGKPIGSFLFLGTTGVGKTELCKALAEYLFDSKDMIVRIDMSEYQQEFSVARLYGAPPGYVGYDQGGQLTEAVRRKPYSVVLFDEIEKAHPKVFETLLQVLDDGRMTDGQGRVVNFKNTIIIMTSNMGQSEILQNLVGQEATPERVSQTSEAVLGQLKRRVAPEFINRIDEVVMFLPLNQEDICQIVELQMRSLCKKMASNEISISYTPAVVARLARDSYKPEYGGRPVKRAINEQIINAISQHLLVGDIKKELPIQIDVAEGEIIFANC